MDTIASAAVKYINTLADVTALLGSFPSTDAANSGKALIFGGDMLYTMEGTSAVGIVCRNYGSYTTAPDLSTWMAWRLGVTFWVDPARDGNGNYTESAITTQSRGQAVFTQLNVHLHRTNPDTQQWGDLVTTSCRLLTAPNWLPITDTGPATQTMAAGTTSHPQVGTAFYGVTVFGITDAES